MKATFVETTVPGESAALTAAACLFHGFSDPSRLAKTVLAKMKVPTVAATAANPSNGSTNGAQQTAQAAAPAPTRSRLPTDWLIDDTRLTEHERR